MKLAIVRTRVLVPKLGSFALLVDIVFRLVCRNRVYLQITQTKLQWSAQSKIGSLENTGHKPRGGDKKIETVKLDFSRSRSKVGSKDYITHVPGGGDVKVSGGLEKS